MWVIEPYITSCIASIGLWCVNGKWFGRLLTIIEMFIG